MDEPLPASRADAIAAYRMLLRSFIERRPLGLRGRLALAPGKHKSFVSQLTNPAYGVPIPAADLPIIVDIRHLSAPSASSSWPSTARPIPSGRSACRGAGPRRTSSG